MPSIFRTILGALALMMLLSLPACYGKHVRNLASDVALIKAGETRRQDVIAYLGEPDEKATAENGMEKWLFREKEESMLKSTPLLKNVLPRAKQEVIIVLLKGDTVVSSRYGAIDFEEKKWADDFDWQEKQQ